MKIFRGWNLKLKQMFRALKYPNYRIFFFGQLISLCGTWMQRIAMSWLVYRLTGSAFLLGVAGFADRFTSFILSPFTGYLADHWERRKILLITQFLAMIQALALAAMYWSGFIEIKMLIALSMIHGIIYGFDVPARQAFVVELVKERQDISNAIALNSFMFNSAKLIGPALAGVLISQTSEGVCFLINGISYLFALTAFFYIRPYSSSARPPLPKPAAGMRKGIVEGFVYAWEVRKIRNILILMTITCFAGLNYIDLMPLFVDQLLSGDSLTLGYLMTATGIGALIGATFLASTTNLRGLESKVLLSPSLLGICLFIFARSTSFHLSMVLMLLAGIAVIIQFAGGNTIIHSVVSDNMRGRIMSIYVMTFMGAVPIGSLVFGALSSYFSAQLAITAGALLCLAGSVRYYFRSSQASTSRRQVEHAIQF